MIELKIELQPSNLESPCWIWKGSVHRGTGYGRISQETAHIIVYKSLMSYEAQECDIFHHKCNVRLCVNPTHLEITTRGKHRGKHSNIEEDRCKIHPSVKLKVVNSLDGYSRHICTICLRAARPKYRQKAKHKTDKKEV